MRTHSPHAETHGDPADALRSMELFAGLPKGELEEIAALCDIATAHPGQVVQAQDVPVRLWHVIAAGHAVVQRDDTPLGLIGRGGSWSEHSLLNGLRSSIAVVALSPLTLFTLRLRQFFAILKATPSWPADWWRGQPPRPTDWRCPSSMPWSTWAWPAADRGGPLGARYDWSVPVTPARGGVKRF